MSLAAWALALLITLAAASFQGTIGLGFAMVSVPLLSLIDPSLAPAPQLLIVLPLAIAMVWQERHAIDLHGFWWIIAGRLPGAFAGVALLSVASRDTLDIVIALLVLVTVGVLASGVHVRRTPMTKFIAGTASGATGVVASIGGPPMALVYSAEESDTIRSTLAAVFTIGVSTSIVFRYASGNLTGGDVRVALILFPAVVAGYVGSVFLKSRVNRAQVRVSILLVSGAAAVALLLRSVLG